MYFPESYFINRFHDNRFRDVYQVDSIDESIRQKVSLSQMDVLRRSLDVTRFGRLP